MSARILVTGGPRVGKTTLARSIGALHGLPVRSTDDLIATHDWSAASSAVAAWLDDVGPWVIEGVAIPRSLRKWLATHDGAPADGIFIGRDPREARSAGQDAMAKGLETVWAEIAPELERRGVPIHLF